MQWSGHLILRLIGFLNCFRKRKENSCNLKVLFCVKSFDTEDSTTGTPGPKPTVRIETHTAFVNENVLLSIFTCHSIARITEQHCGMFSVL